VSQPDGSIAVKIADLGVGREVSQQTAMLHTFYGTPLYASPELVDNQPYNEKTDVWSLGVVLCVCCCGPAASCLAVAVSLTRFLVHTDAQVRACCFVPAVQRIWPDCVGKSH